VSGCRGAGGPLFLECGDPSPLLFFLLLDFGVRRSFAAFIFSCFLPPAFRVASKNENKSGEGLPHSKIKKKKK
jgi:hypothetical protein